MFSQKSRINLNALDVEQLPSNHLVSDIPDQIATCFIKTIQVYACLCIECVDKSETPQTDLER